MHARCVDLIRVSCIVSKGPCRRTARFLSGLPKFIFALQFRSGVGRPSRRISIILQVVVGNTTRGDIITLNESYTAAPVSLPTAVSELRFQLKDVTGKDVDLEGHDMSFALATQ